MNLLSKHFVSYIAFVLLLILIVWGRLIFIQAEHFQKGLAHEHNGEVKVAIREYDLAMHMYTPGSPYQVKAAQRLWDIGQQYESEGDTDWALIAYTSIRSSYFASRSFFTPGMAWIDRCNEKIASLSAAEMNKTGNDLMGSSEEDIKRSLLSLLRYENAPSVWYVLCVEVALAGWIMSIVYIVFKGFTQTGAPNYKEALKGCISFSFFLIIWMIALVLV